LTVLITQRKIAKRIHMADSQENAWGAFIANAQKNLSLVGRNFQALGSRFAAATLPPAFARPLPLAAVAPAAARASAAASASRTHAISLAEVGRSSWTFLHAVAAQYPDRPTRQQQRDARDLIQILTRVYPCATCAQHFKEIVR
jgi:mitochondrial FAD-linked sulfhydryl oxidase